MKVILALVLSLSALSAGAQNVVAGAMYGDSVISWTAYPSATFVDVAHPASADGAIHYVAVRWTGGTGCTSAFKVKFFRPNAPLTSLTLVDARGPFNATGGVTFVQLQPAVQVKQGDFLAVTKLSPPSGCGSTATHFDEAASVLFETGDYNGGAVDGRYFHGQSLAVRATDTAEVKEGFVPAVGSLQGAFGSTFRTALQIACIAATTCTGKIVFHPAGTPFSPNDQELPYTVSGPNAASWDDIVQHMGKSGLGSLDVISNDGAPPLVTARVYNDGGSAGTSGFTEEMVITGNNPIFAVEPLLMPPDLTNYRVNIGVRTLSEPVSLTIQLGYRAVGNVTIPANTFQQFSLASLGLSPLPNEMVFLFPDGPMFAYMTTTDNRTNDGSIRYARHQ